MRRHCKKAEAEKLKALQEYREISQRDQALEKLGEAVDGYKSDAFLEDLEEVFQRRTKRGR